MRAFWVFSHRNRKEILRDPLNLSFGLGFPLVLLILLSVMQKNIPIPMFEITSLSPGVAVFGLSFLALFSGTLLARDRESAFLFRLRATPIRPAAYVFGYLLPLLPIGLAQTAICVAFSALFGLPLNGKALLLILSTFPILLVYLAIGTICGTCLGTKQVGGVCGAMLTNVSAWLSGTWFDTALLGDGFSKVCHCLPFANAVDLGRHILSGNSQGIGKPLAIVSAYAVVLTALAIVLFTNSLKRDAAL